MIELNCKVVKKVATPSFLHQPPFSGLSPLSSKTFHTPRSDSSFGRSYPPPLNKRGGGGSNYGWRGFIFNWGAWGASVLVRGRRFKKNRKMGGAPPHAPSLPLWETLHVAHNHKQWNIFMRFSASVVY